MEGDKINIKLTKDEAIVLYDFLARINEPDDYNNLFEDQAEQRILWGIETHLEKLLSEPFQQDYQKILILARTNVKDDMGK